MEWVAIVTVLMALQLIFFAIKAGQAREKYGVKAPSTDGPEGFQRAQRVHLNTVEQSVVVIPLLWAAAAMNSRPEYAAILGLIYFIGRFLYGARYVTDPESRGPGMMMGFFASIALALLTLWGAIGSLLGSS